MNAHRGLPMRPDTSVMDTLRSMELAAETLRDMREHAERTVRAMEARIAANSAAYFEKDAHRG